VFDDVLLDIVAKMSLWREWMMKNEEDRGCGCEGQNMEETLNRKVRTVSEYSMLCVLALPGGNFKDTGTELQ